jgi:hypothetical protein
LLVNAVGHLLGLIPFGNVGLNLGLHPLSDFCAQGCVSLVKVGRVVLQSFRRSAGRSKSAVRRILAEGTYTLVP